MPGIALLGAASHDYPVWDVDQQVALRVRSLIGPDRRHGGRCLGHTRIDRAWQFVTVGDEGTIPGALRAADLPADHDLVASAHGTPGRSFWPTAGRRQVLRGCNTICNGPSLWPVSNLRT